LENDDKDIDKSLEINKENMEKILWNLMKLFLITDLV
jgi:hypothetical protein